MATTTTNLGLTQPDAAEGYDVSVFNTNAALIDNAVGALQNELGGTGGGLGEKVDTLLENVAAVKTDTAALVQALATANANIATLLTQTKGVKAIASGNLTVTSTGLVSVNIPATMNPEKVIILVDHRAPGNGSTTAFHYGVSWTRTGASVVFSAGVPSGSLSYQFIEFY